MWGKRITFLLVVSLILSAASCGSTSGDFAKIGRVNITTDINLDNSPVFGLEKVINTSPQIFTTVEIINGRRGDLVKVVWKYNPTDRVVATEYFNGRRDGTKTHEFIGGEVADTSWLSSVITLNDFNWPTGGYLVSVTLNNNPVRTLSFEVVTEADYNLKAKQQFIKSINFGKEINTKNQIITSAENFKTTDENIYASVLFANVPAKTKIKASWQFLDTGQTISEFSQDFSGNGYLAFNLNLDLNARTVWLRGNYIFQLYVDNLLVITKNFTIS